MALIDIGSTKQLFLDDYIVESMTDAKKGVNPAVKADHNPILRAERPWEGNHLSGGKVIYDDDEGLFKMWYSGTNLRVDPERKTGAAPGASSSSARTKPSSASRRPKTASTGSGRTLGLVEFQGSKDNNILPPGSHLSHLQGPPREGPVEALQAP